ncbi:hypothetical protein VCHA51O444_120044 [Vibrio chagasii]|nr:hypothetical protein VCHA51O444_120044 [Vibrio chagasii]
MKNHDLLPVGAKPKGGSILEYRDELRQNCGLVVWEGGRLNQAHSI